jgi:hypothetical protein
MVKVMGINARIRDRFAPRHLAPAKPREIAASACTLWLAQGFQNGSPQEDWLRA